VTDKIYLELESRIILFTSLRLEALDRLSLKHRLDESGCAENTPREHA